MSQRDDLYRFRALWVKAFRVPIEHLDTTHDFMTGHGAIAGMMMSRNVDFMLTVSDQGYDIETPGGVLHASPGDWIIFPPTGECVTMPPQTFSALFDKAVERQRPPRAPTTPNSGRESVRRG